MKKTQILTSIEHLFFEKNFKEVSMQDIANILSMKKASLYYHFQSKEALIEEVLEHSFEKYYIFLQDIISKWNSNNFKQLLQEFLAFPQKQKNIFSIINQNGYKENDNISEIIAQKQKIIFDTIHRAMEQKVGFTPEKTYLFLLLIHQIGKNSPSYSLCDIDQEKISQEFEKLFFN